MPQSPAMWGLWLIIVVPIMAAVCLPHLNMHDLRPELVSNLGLGLIYKYSITSVHVIEF